MYGNAARQPPCMLKSLRNVSEMCTAVGEVAERSEATAPTAAGDRSTPPGPFEAVDELDRRRSLNQARTAARAAPASRRTRARISQGRDSFMHLDDSVNCSVGIDVSKAQLDVHLRPEGRSFHVPNTPDGHAVLRAAPRCRRRAPAASRSKRPASMANASPRNWSTPGITSRSSIRDRFAITPRRSASSPRPIASMPTSSLASGPT